MKNIKFSKNYNDIINIKKDFYENNLSNLKNVLKINKKYSIQPKRKFCKNCGKKSLKKFIKNFLIDYKVCKTCGHLNGTYQDTNKFTKWLYEDKGGKNYSKSYFTDFNKRVKNIYSPKAKFLKETIKKIKLIEIGSGGGHFLKALELEKINAIGYEPNKSLVNLGKKFLKKNKIINCSINETYKIMLNQKNFNVVALIAVLEHLNNPNIFLKNFIKSNIEYLYISVPLLSLSVFIENVFKNVFPRHLSGGHTHLYTKKSINYLIKKNNLKIVGEWWFGTDIADLYRSILISGNYNNKEIYLNKLNKNLYDVIDELQNVLDKNKICSEVHMILKKN